MNRLRRGFLLANSMVYRQLFRRIIFLTSAQTSHDMLVRMMAWADQSPRLCYLADWLHQAAFESRPVSAGGVKLDFPFVVAAGLVKGHGFASEADAVQAVQTGENIMPGWRSMPKLAGAVEFGSFTRYPRLGNPGTVIWRRAKTDTTQNRVGLKNPGVTAAAKFLGLHREELPAKFGINIAVTPGVNDPVEASKEVISSLGIFLSQKVIPAWFTLNLSCPNTEDDPGGNQTEAFAARVCKSAAGYLRSSGVDVPLWVKISPQLSAQQYDLLMRVFGDTGVRAVIATNTLPMPSPDNPEVNAGVGGLELHQEAMVALTHLVMSKIRHHSPVDVIGCGGVIDGKTYRDFRTLGVEVIQYWSALVFRGPLAAAIIESELPLEAYASISTSGRAGAPAN